MEKKTMTREEILLFMNNEQNARKCDECPYNYGFKNDSPDFKLPCGQQNCWVRVTCHPEWYHNT